MTRFVNGSRQLVLLIVRIALGVVLIARGWSRWQGSGVEFQISYLERTDTPFADWATWGSIALELVGGLFLIVGALTPVVAGVVALQQILIIVWTKWFKGLALNGPWGDGWEYTLITACVSLVLVVFGAGSVSIDRLFRRTPARSGFDDEDDED